MRMHQQILPRIVLVLALAMGVSLSTATIYRYSSVPSDFTQDYLGALSLLNGNSVYSELHCGIKNSKVCTYGDKLLNDHPPGYITVLSPLVTLRYEVAFMVVGLLSLCSLVLSILLVARQCGFSWYKTGCCVAAFLLSPPVYAAFATGNLTIVIGFLVVLAWQALNMKREMLASFYIGLAISIKLYPALFVFYLLASKRYGMVRQVFGVCLGCFLVSSFVVGWRSWEEYFLFVAPRNTANFVSHAFNLSISGVFYRLLGDFNPWSPWLARILIAPRAAFILSTVAVTLFMGFLFRELFLRKLPLSLNRGFSLISISMILLPPLSWGHSLVFLLIPILTGWKTKILSLKPWHLVALTLPLFVPEKELATFLIRIGGYPLPWYFGVSLFLPLATVWLLLFYWTRNEKIAEVE